MIVIVGGLKGGVGKTTTAMHLATAMALRGRSVHVIDADPASQSAYDWQCVADLNDSPMLFPVHTLTASVLEARVAYMDSMGHDLIIDVGGDTGRTLVAALKNGGFLLMPHRPNLIEMRRIPATVDIAMEVMRQGAETIYHASLLVAVNGNRPADEEKAREYLKAQNIPTLGSKVRDLGQYARAFGYRIDDPGSDYMNVYEELFEVGVVK